MDLADHTAKALERVEQALTKPYHPSPRMARAIALREAIYALQPGQVPPAAQMTLLLHDALEQEADLAKTQAIVTEENHP